MQEGWFSHRIWKPGELKWTWGCHRLQKYYLCWDLVMSGHSWRSSRTSLREFPLYGIWRGPWEKLYLRAELSCVNLVKIMKQASLTEGDRSSQEKYLGMRADCVINSHHCRRRVINLTKPWCVLSIEPMESPEREKRL